MYTISIESYDFPECKHGFCRNPVKYTYDTERFINGEIESHDVKFSCAHHTFKEIKELTFDKSSDTIYNEDGSVYIKFAYTNKYVNGTLRKLVLVSK